MADDPLFRYLAQPDRRHLAEVVRAHHVFVWKVAFGVTRNREDAADICQDVFLKLLLQPPPRARIGSVRGYLALKAISRASGMRRATQRRKVRESEYIRRASEDSLPSDDVDALLAAIDGLSEELRVPLELHHLAGLENAEIGETLGISRERVRQIESQALAKLRRSTQVKALAGYLN